MRDSRVMPNRLALAAAATLSLTLHLLAGVLIVSPWARLSHADDQLAAVLPEVPTIPQQPRLGVERSKAVTVTWVGFETPSEHQAPKSEVEQALLSPAPGQSPVAAAEPAPPTPPPAPPEPAPEQIAPQPPAPAAPAREPLPMDVLAPVAIAPSIPASSSRPTPEPTTPADAARQTPAPKPQPVSPAATPSEAATGRPGLQDPRESDAAALQNPLEYRPGKPLAGQGIQITTVSPNFGTTVRMLSNPNNPVIVIDFDRAGHVRRARFARSGTRPLDTGNSFIDGAILDAVYRWTAKGKPIDALEDDRVLTYSVRLLLRG